MFWQKGKGGEIVSRKIVVLLLAAFLLVMLFTASTGFAQAGTDCREEAKAGGVVAKAPCEPVPPKKSL